MANNLKKEMSRDENDRLPHQVASAKKAKPVKPTKTYQDSVVVNTIRAKFILDNKENTQ